MCGMSHQNEQSGQRDEQAGQRDETVVVVTPQGMGMANGEGDARSPAELVEEPAKVMRIGSMIKQLLEEVRNSPLDEKGRARLAEVHERSLTELEQGLAPELVDELRRITLPFDEETTPSDAELVGWLEGLFHGIQTALFAQQMAARSQIEQMRRALPGGPAAGHPGMPGMGQPGQHGPDEGQRSTGQYL
jgi:hypothetical protein